MNIEGLGRPRIQDPSVQIQIPMALVDTVRQQCLFIALNN